MTSQLTVDPAFLTSEVGPLGGQAGGRVNVEVHRFRQLQEGDVVLRGSGVVSGVGDDLGETNHLPDE